MSDWVLSISIAILAAGVPLTWVHRILQGLPKPLAASHRRWPAPLNMALVGGVTAYTAVFIHGAYYTGGRTGAEIGVSLLIALVVYAFGFVLILRQFTGLYPEYFVATGRSGLTVRKTLYRNVVGVDRLGESQGETRLMVRVEGGAALPLDLPTRDVVTFFQLIEKSRKLD